MHPAHGLQYRGEELVLFLFCEDLQIRLSMKRNLKIFGLLLRMNSSFFFAASIIRLRGAKWKEFGRSDCVPVPERMGTKEEPGKEKKRTAEEMRSWKAQLQLRIVAFLSFGTRI